MGDASCGAEEGGAKHVEGCVMRCGGGTEWFQLSMMAMDMDRKVACAASRFGRCFR